MSNNLEFNKDFRTPYKGKENVTWEIKWKPTDGVFAFFLHVKKGEEKTTYVEIIPNSILIAALGNIDRMNDIVETCVEKLNRLNNTNFREH